MQYTNWLEYKNLSPNTVCVYSKMVMQWQLFLNGRTPTKALVVKFISDYSLNHKARSVRLMYAVIMSFFKFEKRYKLIGECGDIKLPSTQFNLKSTITLHQYNKVKKTINCESWKQERDWIIFSFLFYTGLRVSELLQFKKSDIQETNKLLIKGKGNKYRMIYLNSYLISLLDKWNLNRITVSSTNNLLSTKQINIIIKEVSLKYFNKIITPHGLRRSYATNLLRSNVNIEIVRKILGHSNINTTSKYIQYTDDEMIEILSKAI